MADCLISVDGTDFKIMELGPLFSSHKYAKKSALRYEVGICIQTGDIVWINGPFEPGMWPDINIIRSSLRSFLSPKERVEADDGYIGNAPMYIKCPKSFVNPEETERMQSIVRQRHETINKRFKDWGILAQRFRHNSHLAEHGDVFWAVAVMEQASINKGEKAFQVEYE